MAAGAECSCGDWLKGYASILSAYEAMRLRAEQWPPYEERAWMLAHEISFTVLSSSCSSRCRTGPPLRPGNRNKTQSNTGVAFHKGHHFSPFIFKQSTIWKRTWYNAFVLYQTIVGKKEPLATQLGPLAADKHTRHCNWLSSRCFKKKFGLVDIPFLCCLPNSVDIDWTFLCLKSNHQNANLIDLKNWYWKNADIFLVILRM